MTRQANFLLPEDLLEELRRAVPKRRQSGLVAEALRKELKRLRLESALEASFGAWEKKDHPELRGGTDARVRSLRRSTRPLRSK